ncbi:TonB-dependent receptor [Desulfatibacillum aliphaticivorans]|uniref:TonB-dependent receptor n=1 Tax=Desulfatibacillum aliphaticivorans TaxID=218208 RepID=UPI0004062B47|nr:TonB-dependent receptor [Desulfatibacillum aliphaticivorans]
MKLFGNITIQRRTGRFFDLTFFIVFTMFMSISPLVWAQNEEAPGEEETAQKQAMEADYVLNDMVVTAQRLPDDFRTGDVDQENAPSFFTVIPREQFIGKMENLAQVLKKEAGIQVKQSGGLGSFSTVSLRGSSSDQVMIYLDGILLNDASGGGVDLSNISLADVSSINVYRGVSPASFGKAGIGGVINIKTLRAQKGTKYNVGLGYGSFDTKKAFGFINHKPGKADFLLSADYLGSANDFEFKNDMGTSWNKVDDQIQKRNNAEFYQYNVLAKAGWDANRNLRFDLVNQYFFKDQNLPNWINMETASTNLTTSRNITTMRLGLNNVTPLALNTAASISYSDKEEKYDDQEGSVGLGKQLNKYNTQRWTGDLYTEWISDYNILAAKMEYQHEDYSPEDLLQEDDPRDSNRDYIVATLQDTLMLLSQRVILTPAVRYAWLDDELESGTTVWGSQLEKSERKDEYWMPQCGLKVKPWEWISLKANAAQYVREPSFFELFGDRGFFIGNEELEAEKGTNFDVGFEVNYLTGWTLINRVYISSAYFKNDVDDLITRIYDSRGVGKSVNISESEITGVESQAAADFLNLFTVSGNATWQDAVNASEISTFNNKKLPGRYEWATSGKVEFHYKGFKIYSEYFYEAGNFYDAANLLEAPEKKELNAGAAYLFKGFSIELQGKNLRDKRYEDYNGYPLPGRAYYLTIKFEG